LSRLAAGCFPALFFQYGGDEQVAFEMFKQQQKGTPIYSSLQGRIWVPGWSGGTVNQQVLLAKTNQAGMLVYSTVFYHPTN